MIFTPPEELELPPRAGVWHWTGGVHTSNPLERDSYALLFEYHGNRVVPRAGVPISRNMRSLQGVPSARRDREQGYAAHAGGFNTRTIGFAACCMLGATDHRPQGGAVNPGRYPLTIHQVRALLGHSAMAARTYPTLRQVSVDTWCTHEEVYRVHGRGNPGKWNVTWLPGFDIAPEHVGPYLREQLVRWLEGRLIDDRLYAPPVGLTREEALEGDEEP